MAKSALLRRLEALETGTFEVSSKNVGVDTFTHLLARYEAEPLADEAAIDEFRKVLASYNSKPAPYGDIVTEILRCKLG